MDKRKIYIEQFVSVKRYLDGTKVCSVMHVYKKDENNWVFYSRYR